MKFCLTNTSFTVAFLHSLLFLVHHFGLLVVSASSFGFRRVPRLGSRPLLGPRLLGDCESLPWRLALLACRAEHWPGLGSVFLHVACPPNFSSRTIMIFLFGFGCCFSRTDTTGRQRRETPIAGSLHAGSDHSKYLILQSQKIGGGGL